MSVNGTPLAYVAFNKEHHTNHGACQEPQSPASFISTAAVARLLSRLTGMQLNTLHAFFLPSFHPSMVGRSKSDCRAQPVALFSTLSVFRITCHVVAIRTDGRRLHFEILCFRPINLTLDCSPTALPRTYLLICSLSRILVLLRINILDITQLITALLGQKVPLASAPHARNGFRILRKSQDPLVRNAVQNIFPFIQKTGLFSGCRR